MKKVIFNFFPTLLLSAILITGCGKSGEHLDQITFTKADSLAERFLELQDSTLTTWNTLISDEHEKFRSMHELIHELLLSSQSDKEQLVALENRLNNLSEMELTQMSIDNPSFLEEYDFTTSAIVTELITLGESHEKFAQNKMLRKLVDNITLVDQRVENNRTNYDMIVTQYNQFIARNKSSLHEFDNNTEIKTKPLFQEISQE
jgi:hypothetical protein